MEKVLREQRIKKHTAIETEPHRDEEKDRAGEIAVLEDPEIDDGMLVPRRQLPPQHRRERYRRDDAQSNDQCVVEPILLASLLQDVLQTRQTDSQQADAEPVDRTAAPLRVRRIVQKARHEKNGHDPDRNVDEEAPTPVVVV